MKVQGGVDLVQSNLNFYSRLTSTSHHRKVDDLRSYYYSVFLEDARRSMRAMIGSKPVDKSTKDSVCNEAEPTTTHFLSEVQSISVSEEGVGKQLEFSASSFLDAVKSEAIKVLDSKLADVQPVGDIVVCEVHGTILDEVSIVEAEVHGITLDYVEVEERVVEKEDVVVPENVGSIVKGDVHGVILDNIGVSNTDCQKVKDKPDLVQKVDVRGVILDDVVISDCKFIEPEVYQYEKVDVTESIITEEDNVWSISEEVDIVHSGELNTSERRVADNIIPIREGVGVNIPRADEVVNVPPTVREFLKKRPGCEISLVEKYYPKKVIDKEIKLGKIYKKGNKLFI